ncbi:MAG: thioredoxin family protein [Lachnotalea sp.]
MGLFKKKKEEVSSCSCSCGETTDSTKQENENSLSEEAVKVLGSGCAKCNELEANVKSALEQLGMDTKIEHVTDFTKIAAYGVMSTPALVVDGKVVSYGKVLKTEEVVKLVKNL